MGRKILGKHSKKATQGELDLKPQETVTALYLRVSTEKQASEGYGLDAQRSELDAYCEVNGWTVAPERIYTDAGISGKSTDRPAFQAMLQAAQQGEIQRIVTVKLDRIARNLRDLLNTVDALERAGCALVVKKEAFDTSSPQGRFMLQMLGAVGELERSMIAERVQGGRIEKAKQGGFLGAPVLYGYTYVNSEFIVDDTQANIVKTIFTRFVSCESLNAIATSLTNAGILSPSGKGKWNHVTIRNMLSNGFYAGVSQWDGIETTGAHPAIIDRDLYDRAANKLSSLSKGNPDFIKKG